MAKIEDCPGFETFGADVKAARKAKHFTRKDLGQHRTMAAAVFSGSFAPIVQCEKWEIHKVFPHFPHFPLCQNLSLKILAPLCGVALAEKVNIESRYLANIENDTNS